MDSIHTKSLSKISTQALRIFSTKHGRREDSYKMSREIIRLSANAIRATHRGEFELGINLIAQAKHRIDLTTNLLQSHPDIYYSGFLSDARKEFIEARTTLALISQENLPRPNEIRSDMSAYLKGLGEAVGEMRRFILDSLRKNDLNRCEEIMGVMDELYGILVNMDFPEGVTGGLRHTTDMVRGTLERTRGDLTMALRQRDLQNRLESWENSSYSTTPQNKKRNPTKRVEDTKNRLKEELK